MRPRSAAVLFLDLLVFILGVLFGSCLLLLSLFELVGLKESQVRTKERHVVRHLHRSDLCHQGSPYTRCRSCTSSRSRAGPQDPDQSTALHYGRALDRIICWLDPLARQHFSFSSSGRFGWAQGPRYLEHASLLLLWSHLWQIVFQTGLALIKLQGRKSEFCAGKLRHLLVVEFGLLLSASTLAGAF